MNEEAVVNAQLEAYNDRDIDVVAIYEVNDLLINIAWFIFGDTRPVSS